MSDIRTLTLDENYTELMEDGVQWVRLSDHKASIERLRKVEEAAREVTAAHQQLDTPRFLAALDELRDALEAK